MLLPYLYNADTGWNVKGGLKTWFKGAPITDNMSNTITDVSKLLANGQGLDDVFDSVAQKWSLATDEANRLKVAFQNFNTEGKNTKQITTGVTSSLQGLTGGLNTAAIKQAAMNVALNAMVSIGVGTALTLIAKGYQYLAEYQEKTVEAGREATNAIKESNQAYQENATWLNQNADRYAELAKGVERGKNISLTTAEFEEYNQLAKEVANRFPELITGYDSLGNAILSCGSDVNKLNDALAGQKDNNLAETLGKTKEIVDSFKMESNTSKSFLQALGFGETTVGQESTVVDTLLESATTQEEFINAYNSLSIDQHNLMSEMYADAGVETDNITDYYENIDVLINKSKELKQAQIEAAEGMQELASAYLQDNVVFKGFGEEAQNALLNIADNLSYDFFTTQNLENASDFREWSNEVAKAIKDGELENALTELTSFSFTSLTKNSLRDLNNYATQVAQALKIEDIEEFKLQLGIDEESFNASLQAAKETLVEEMGVDFVDHSQTTKWLNSLTQSELEVVANFKLRGTETLDDLKRELEGVIALNKNLETLSSNVDNTLSGYGTVTTALSELNSEGRITSETLEALKGTLGDVEGLYQYTSQGIQVNAQALKEMADNTAEATLAEIEMREALDVHKYQDKVKELEKYCDAHEGLKEALANNELSEYTENVKNTSNALSELEVTAIEALYAETTALAESINGYDELEMRIQAATSALNDYVRAQQTANASDNMQTAAGGLEGAKELYKQGWTTKDDYTSYMDYIGYQDKGSDNYVKYAEELFKRAGRYLTEDASGVHKFINDMIKKGIEGVEGSDYTNVKFTPQVDLDEVAKEMDMTVDFVTDMFLAMRDAGYEVNFSSLTEGIVDGLQSINPASEAARTDLESFRKQIDKLREAGIDVSELEAIYAEVAKEIQSNPVNFDPTLASIDELTIKSKDAYTHLSELAKSSGVDFEFNADLDDEIPAIRKQLESLQEFRDTNLTIGTDEWKDANILIAQTVQQLHQAEKQIILDVDTSSLNEKTAEVVELLQKFRELQNEKEIQLAVDPNFDSSEIDSELENLRSKLSGLNDKDYNTIKTHLMLDESSVESLDKTISQITPEMTGKLTSLELGENVGVVTITADGTPARAETDAVVQYINLTKALLTISGNNEPAKQSADSGVKYIENLDPTLDVEANMAQALRDIRSKLLGPFSINVRANVSGLPGNISPANGTAHARGTVYHYPHAFSEGSALWQHYRNASRQAYAGGHWGLNNDEQGALINELGPEIIVRDGEWFTINNGYPTLTDLRAGDIIFNHEQSKAILSKGYVTGSHAKMVGTAHAEGTIGGKAFANVSGGATNLVKPSTASSKSSKNIVDTTKKSTKAVDKALEELERAFDWIAIKFERLARNTEKAEAAIERARTRQGKLNASTRAINSVQAEKRAADKAADKYLDQAKQIAKSTGLSESLQKQVQNGSIRIGDYGEKTQEKIQKYQEAYNNYLDAIDMVAELSDKEKELALQRLAIIDESYESIKALREASIDLNESRLDLIEAKGGTDDFSKIEDIYENSIKQAEKNLATSKNGYKEYKDEFDSLVASGYLTENTQEYREYLTRLKELETAMNEAELTVLELEAALREKALERLDEITEFYDAIKDVRNSLVDLNQSKLDLIDAKGLSAVSETVKEIYRSSIEQAKAIHAASVEELNAYKAEMNQLIEDGYLEEGTTEYNEYLATLNDLEVATIEAEIAVLEFQDALRDVEFERIQNFIDALDRASNKLNNQIDLMEARDEDIPEEMYQDQINNNNARLEYLSEQLDDRRAKQALEEVGSDNYKELAKEIAQIEDEMYGLLIQNEELKDSIVETRFADVNDDIDELNKLQAEISDTRSMLDSDDFLDKDGNFTSEGVTNIALITEEISLLKQETAECTEALNKLEEAYANGLISEKEYNEMSEEYRDNIRDNAKQIDSLEDSLEDLYETQLEKQREALKEQLQEENELLQKNIEKRKEALQRKADYYDYDRNIRNKTKDINMLKAQIAAMDGVVDEASRAEKKRLEAQLKEAEEDLAETKRQHAIDMQMQEYDDMARDLNETLEKNLDAIEDNADQQEVVIQNMLDSVVGRYDEAYGKINDIINKTGLNVSDSFNELNEQLNSVEGSQNLVDNVGKNPSDFTPGAGSTGINTGNVDLSNGGKNDTIEEQLSKPEQLTGRHIAQITLSTNSVRIKTGESTTVSVTEIKPSDASGNTLMWKSSNRKIATVSGGTITGIADGKCTVTCRATDGGGVEETVSVTVVGIANPPSSLPNISDAPSFGQVPDSPTVPTTKFEDIVPQGTKQVNSSGIQSGINSNNGLSALVTSDGDGKPEVGDQVIVNGKWTAESSGKGDSGNLSDAQAKIAKITTGNNRNYQVTLESGKKVWVTKKQLEGYSKGLYKAKEEEWAWTQEDVNGKSAPEIVVAPDGGILTKIEPGSSVIPNNFAQNLYELGANPNSFFDSATKQINTLVNNIPNYMNSPQLGQITNHYDSLLTVNGNVDNEVLPKLEDWLKESYKYTTNHLAKDAKKLGIRGIR